MADEISIGSKAIKEVQELRAELVKTSEAALQIGKNLSTISTPGGLNKSGADNAKLTAELDALKTKYVQLNDTIVKKAEQSRLAEIRLQQQREKAFDSFSKNAKKEEETLRKAEGAYQRIQNSVNILTKTYNDLAIRKELGNTLSAKEEAQLKTLSTRINTYQDALKKTDSQIGKNQRNVGNYASGYNALGNSINQLTREAPAFANSLNTGFMAISNNIPALTDAIKGIREQNALLRSEGKPTTSVLSQLAGALFSWQTAISLGVTLLTVYGGTIVKWIQSLNQSETALSANTRAQQSLNRAQAEAEKGTSDEITHLQLLNKTATDTSLSMNARKNAVKEMQELYPHYLGNLSEEAILTGQTSDQMKELTKNIFAAAVARGIEGEISKKAMSDYKARKLLIGGLNTDLQNYRNYIKTFDSVTNKDQKDAYTLNAKVQFQMTRERKLAALKALEDQQEAENEILIKGYKKQVELSGKLGPDGKDESDKKAKKVKQADPTPKVKELETTLKSVGTVITQVNEELGRLFTEKIVTDNPEELAAINFQIESLTKLKEQLNNVPTTSGEIINTTVVKKTTEALHELTAGMKDYLSSFTNEFAQNSGFTETFKLMNGEIEGFGTNWQVTATAIAESAQEMYNFISNASQQNFDNEKERLQNQYDVAYKFANGNKEAEEKLADDLEAKKKDIANRENKAKQQQAIFNIAIDTAQAILGLWAKPGFPAAIPMAIAVGALGAAQIAIVASQKIPQYWTGGTHDGGLMMVNDGAGSNYRETIVTPDGKVMKPTGRNVLMDAPAGTEIFTHSQWESQLNNMLQGNGINWHNQQQSHGISKSDLEEVMLRTIGNQPTSYTNFDENGVAKWINKRGNVTRQATNRGNGRGVNFK